MDNNAEEIKIELDRLNCIPEVAEIASLDMKEFNSEWFHDEYQKIVRARDKRFPTYRSEYRVIMTLLRQRNELLYYFNKTYSDERVLEINAEFVKISKLLNSIMKMISDIFEKEKKINNVVKRFEESFECEFNIAENVEKSHWLDF